MFNSLQDRFNLESVFSLSPKPYNAATKIISKWNLQESFLQQVPIGIHRDHIFIQALTHLNLHKQFLS